MLVYRAERNSGAYRFLAVLAVVLVLSDLVFMSRSMCTENKALREDTSASGQFLAHVEFAATYGTLDEMLAGLVEFQETVEWQEVYGLVPPVDEHMRHDFYSLERRLRTMLPGKDEFWPFVYSWITSHRTDKKCTLIEQPPLVELEPASHGGLCVPYGFAAPYILYRIDKYNSANILFTEVEDSLNSSEIVNWRMMYTIEIGNRQFPEEAGWDLSLSSERALASWNSPRTDELMAGAEQEPVAAWLVFRGKDIGEHLSPALSGVKSLQSRPAVNEHVIRQDDEGPIERFMSLPESESGIYRIYFSVYPKERRQAAEMQDVIADVTTWPAAHVGVFSMDNRGWLLLIFEGADEE